MQIKTHEGVDPRLVGQAVSCWEGQSTVILTAVSEMAVDVSGLVHGGFVFGLADYAAMLAVNDPNVVLGAADVRFLKPVKTGDRLEAMARVEAVNGKKRQVTVTVRREGEVVFEGGFTCFVLDRHILAV